MTDPAEESEGSEVSGNTFSGPTGAQVGSSNMQINHYTMPSPSPGGTGRGARITMVIAAAALVGGIIGFVALDFAPSSDDRPRAGKTSESGASHSGEPSAPRTSKPEDTATSTPPVSPSTITPTAPPSRKPEFGNITPAEEVLCVDVEDNEDYKGKLVQLWNCNHESGQRWTWGEDGTLHTFTGCLDVKDGEKQDETPVRYWECNEGLAQQWEWYEKEEEGQGQGVGKLRNPMSGKCLGYRSVGESETDRNSELAIFRCDSDFARVWTHH